VSEEFGPDDAPRAGENPEDRLPPQDVHAEQSVLGGMLLSKDAIADVVEALRPHDFYRPAHETVYDAVLTLYGRGEPADAITVADELTKRGELARIGGQAYLHQLISSVPTAANAGYYAQIVAERAVLRRLVDAGTRIVQMGYRQGGDVADIVNAAQAEVYGVSGNRGGEDYVILGELLEAAVDEIEHASGSSGELVGVPTGFSDLDELTNVLHSGQMIVIAARPAVGKSTLALDIARAASIRHKMTSVLFSLEMSKTEITMRLLSAEASVQLQKLRKGTVGPDDWQRLARTMGDVSDAPLFIDDSPNMSLMEIRAKCRRLKQRHNLKLVIIDYLQLMSSGKRVESRQQEVSEFSRALKLLAKELEVPVVALSQLNRGPEQRTDKKPMVSDLRESGCLTGDTRIVRADTGVDVTMAELAAGFADAGSGSDEAAAPVMVWSLDESLRFAPREMTAVFSTGVQPVFKMVLASGKVIRATANHPFLTFDGWRALEDLRPGTRIAVPRQLPMPAQTQRWPADDIAAAAQVCATYSDTRVPVEVLGLPRKQISLFLWTLFSLAGGVTVDRDEDRGEIFLFADERELLDRVSLLMMRYGIGCRISRDPKQYVLDIDDEDSQRLFLSEIGIGGDAEESAAQLRQMLATRTQWEGAEEVAAPPELASVVKAVRGQSEALSKVNATLSGLDMDLVAVNDVTWDAVAAITSDGVEPVYDATVAGTHNFVANEIAVHNSIEQDADLVMLLHREAMYEQDSPREGEADIIVAKHRNGPTKTITVAFQGHYSRFTNMATTY
jgi:replicative DNA helicase